MSFREVQTYLHCDGVGEAEVPSYTHCDGVGEAEVLKST